MNASTSSMRTLEGCLPDGSPTSTPHPHRSLLATGGNTVALAAASKRLLSNKLTLTGMRCVIAPTTGHYLGGTEPPWQAVSTGVALPEQWTLSDHNEKGLTTIAVSP